MATYTYAHMVSHLAMSSRHCNSISTMQRSTPLLLLPFFRASRAISLSAITIATSSEPMQIEPKLGVMVRWKALQEPLLASLDDMNHHEATLPAVVVCEMLFE